MYVSLLAYDWYLIMEKVYADLMGLLQHKETILYNFNRNVKFVII